MAVTDGVDLVVVRHGLTSWNRERRYQGQRDIPLLLPEALPDMDLLRDHLAGEVFDAIHASDLTRCRQTLAHLLEGRRAVAPRFDARLRELDFGDYEGRQYDELKHLTEYRRWVDSHGELAPPGGESAAELWRRLDAWLGALLAEARDRGHRRVLAVTHGGVIRELRRRLEAVDFWEGTVGQAQGRRFRFTREGEEWRCSCSSAVPAPAGAVS